MPIDEIAAAQLGLRALGGLLSLPRAFQAQRLEDQIARDAAIQALGYTPEKAAELYPEPGMMANALDPGRYQNPIARGVLGTTGDLGNAINALMGQPIRAPRVDTGALSQLGVLRQKAEEQKENHRISEQFKNPIAQALARQGNLAKAADVEAGGGIEPSLFVNRLQKFLAKGYPMDQAREMAIAEEDAAKRDFARFQGGISLGNTMAGIGARAGVEQQQRGEAAQRGKQFFDQYIVPRLQPQRQGLPQPEPMTLPVPSRRGQGYTLVSDVTSIPSGAPSGPGLVVSGATRTSGGESTLSFRPDPVAEAYDLIDPTVAKQRALIPGSVEEKQALQEVYPNREESDLRRDALFRLDAVEKNERILLPKMEASLAVLSENPVVAKFLQPWLIPWYAKGYGGPLLARAAKELQTLKAHRASLARMVDVGNLSGTEQDVWNPYVLGEEMSVEEMTQAMAALRRDFERMREWNQKIAFARDRDEFRAAFETRPVPAQNPKEYVPPQKTSTTTGGVGSDARTEFESLLNQYSPR